MSLCTIVKFYIIRIKMCLARNIILLFDQRISNIQMSIVYFGANCWGQLAVSLQALLKNNNNSLLFYLSAHTNRLISTQIIYPTEPILSLDFNFAKANFAKYSCRDILVHLSIFIKLELTFNNKLANIQICWSIHLTLGLQIKIRIVFFSCRVSEK